MDIRNEMDRAGKNSVVAIFPASGEAPERLGRTLRYAGLVVIDVNGTSPSSRMSRGVALPDIYDPAFADALSSLVREHRVTRILTTSDVVHQRLSKLRDLLALDMPEESPTEALISDWRRWDDDIALALQQYVDLCTGLGAKAPTTADLAFVRGAAYTARAIPGQSTTSKLLALGAVSRCAPPGDVVEIGAYFGRSTWFLAQVAQRYQLGTTVAVDAWSATVARQVHVENVINDATGDLDWGAIKGLFLDSVSPISRGGITYIQGTSLEANELYRLSRFVVTEEFGEVETAGRVSLLHIDGNHDVEAVREDLDRWGSLVLPGGWIVCDDYRWLHGDGPQVATDEFLRTEASRVCRAFTLGNSAFLQFA